MNAFSYELFINFRLSFYLCVKSIMFDFKKIIHQTKPISDPRNVTWFEFRFRKYMIYPGPGGSATDCLGGLVVPNGQQKASN